MKQVRLNNGVMMPSIGFGVFQIPVGETERIVSEALETGYRMIDTAASYFNEEQVGNAIRQSELKREDIFVTTKLWVQDYEYDDALRAFDLSMKKLGLDYLDLYLLHKPYGNYYAAWRAAERLYKEGRIRAIGVTSFSNERLQDLFLHNEVKPAVNQTGDASLLPAAGCQHLSPAGRHTARSVGALCRRTERHLEQSRPESHLLQAWQDGRAGRFALVESAECGHHPQDRAQGADGGEPRHLRLYPDGRRDATHRHAGYRAQPHL